MKHVATIITDLAQRCGCTVSQAALSDFCRKVYGAGKYSISVRGGTDMDGKLAMTIAIEMESGWLYGKAISTDHHFDTFSPCINVIQFRGLQKGMKAEFPAMVRLEEGLHLGRPDSGLERLLCSALTSYQGKMV